MAEPAPPFEGLHHIGMSVQSLDAALAFWETFLGHGPRWTTLLNRPYLSKVVGYPDVEIKAAFFDLPGGIVIELLDYQLASRTPNPDATANPGNVHVCVKVTDAPESWRRAVAAGARPLSEGPVDIDGGPNKGAKAAYLRIHDGITLELFQPARQETAA
jgi:catechol 2,3-dioxygenase-like lactoylglutathione lyase family enzyme